MGRSTHLARKLHTTGNTQTPAVTKPHDSPQHRQLTIADLTLHESLVSRADGLRQDVIDEYREGVQRGDVFPPITVFSDGSTHYLVDGFYRYYAYRLEQIETIEAEVHQGSLRDALLFSATINQKHGVRRTNADKWKAVNTLLQDQEWSQWSDNAIAKHCGVTHPFVATVRRSLETVTSEQPNRTYRNKYGKRSTMHTPHIGRRGGQRSEALFHTPQVFDHIRQIIQSYALTYPGLQVAYETQRHALTIRVTQSQRTSFQGAVADVERSLHPFLNQIVHGDCLDVLPHIPSGDYRSAL
jgi:hypothetical protein